MKHANHQAIILFDVMIRAFGNEKVKSAITEVQPSVGYGETH